MARHCDPGLLLAQADAETTCFHSASYLTQLTVCDREPVEHWGGSAPEHGSASFRAGQHGARATSSRQASRRSRPRVPCKLLSPSEVQAVIEAIPGDEPGPTWGPSQARLDSAASVQSALRVRLLSEAEIDDAIACL